VPDLNPAEGIWSLLKRSLASLAAADQAGLVRIIKTRTIFAAVGKLRIRGCRSSVGW
jgi:hypothetical protein